MRRLANILHYILFAVILLLMTLYLALQLPPVQTCAINRAISAAEGMFDADISLGSFHFKPFNTVVLKDLAIVDRAPYADDARDTLLRMGSLSVRFSIASLIGPGHQDIILKEVKLRDGQFNLVVENGQYACNLVRMFKLLPPDPPEPMPEADILNIRSIKADNISYTMRIYGIPAMDVPPTAIDWSDMGVDNINLRARNFRISHGLFYANVDHLDFRERTGWNVKELSADLVAGKGLVDIENIHIYDGRSDAYLDFSMAGTSEDYTDFVNRVIMRADIRKSRWSLDALAHFIPPLNPDSTTFVQLKGKMTGPVANLQGNKLRLDIEDSSIGFTLDGGVSKLPDVDNMTFNARLGEVSFRTDDVCKAVNSIAPPAGLNLNNIGKNILYTGNIEVNGPINDMNAKVKIFQGKDRGSANLSARVGNVLRMGNPPISVTGKLSTDELDLRPFTGADSGLGRLCFSSQFSFTVPSSESYITVNADSLNVGKLQFKGYDFGNISGNASLQGEDVTVDIVSEDPALKADVTVWSDKYAYSGAVMIREADLRTIGIDKRDVSKVSMNIYGRLDKDLEKLQGNARVSEIVLTNGEGGHTVPDIALDAVTDGHTYDINLSSGVADASFKGSRKAFKADFKSFSSAPLLAYLLPGTYLEHGTTAEVVLDSAGTVNGNFHSGRIAYNNNYIKDLSAEIYGTLDDLRADVTSSDILAAGFEMNNNAVNARLCDSTLALRYSFSNKGTVLEQEIGDGEFNLDITPIKGKGFILNVKPSRLNIDSNEWTIPESYASINGRDIEVEDLTLQTGDQWIKVDGRTSTLADDMLSAQIHNFDLSPLNRFFAEDIELGGTLDAEGIIYSPFSENMIPQFELTAEAKSICLSGTDLGDISANAIYDRSAERVNIGLNTRIGGQAPLNAEAVYRPSDNTIDAIAYLEEFPIGFAQGFLPDVFSNMEGSLSGRITADGPIGSPNISCDDGRFNDTVLEVAFTHVPYRVDGSFNIDNDGIHFGTAEVTDRYDGTGTAKGGLRWNSFKDMALDLHFDAANIEATDIPASEKGVFYGNIFASGKVDITGPFNDITLSVDATTVKDSDLHLVVSGPLDATKANLLTFSTAEKVEVDPYDEILRKYKSGNGIGQSNFKVRIRAVATPRINVSLDLGSTGFAAGLSGTGNGTVELAVDSEPADFKIYGDYTVSEGNFNVNASNIVHRLFSISNGSSIKFEGDVMESPMNLDAIYQTKASIATLIADTTSVSNRRQVNCGIHIQNTLNNPSVDFSIDIPDLDPSVKSRVESALSTDDKIQKQFLSLLLSNNFLPDEQSGIVNNSSLLYSNVSELMANQVNNIFTKLNIPLDLGLNYQPSETGGANLFDVALSTQLFNNRVIIGGTLGNRQKVSSSNDAFFGDLDIQYKVTRSGALRLSAFSHSVDQYTNTLDNAQRNGIGVTWQQEFDRLPQWLRNLFSDKAKRDALAELAAEEERKTKTLILDE